jgi:N-acetylglucosaminyl-diphospho-decaprenol L-rhamnosyltransferase
MHPVLSPIVRVIIVNFNGGPHLRRCVACLIRQSEARFEAVIVDNASTDGSLEGLPADPRLRLLRLQDNTGFAKGNNIGIAGCAAPLVALLNPDAFPEPGWLAALVQAAQSWPDAVMFGSLQVCADSPELLDGLGDVYFCAGTSWRGGHRHVRPRIAAAAEAFGPCAAAALYRTEWFRHVGGFDERFFSYAEDVDLAFRLRLAGGRCIQVPDAVVAHVGSAVTGEMSEFSVYHLTRNQIWTFLKCMPWPLLWLLLPAHVLLVVATLVRARRHGRSRAVARGVRDAVYRVPEFWVARRAVQSRRRASVGEIAAALAWSPLTVLRRAPVLKPLPSVQPRPPLSQPAQKELSE